jgi:hypothetical protein
MFSYSVKYVCGQNAPPPSAPAPTCSPVRQRIYATEINIHNFNRTPAEVEKRVLQLVQNDKPVGREPESVQAKAFDRILLKPETATMDDCCRFAEKLQFNPAHLNIGFLEILSNVELNVVAVYTATDLKSNSIAIELETINARKLG